MNNKQHATVLFTGGGGAGTEGLNKLLGDRYEIHFADADRDARPASIAPERWHTIPFAAKPEFGSEVAELCRKIAANVVVPGVDEELPIIARLRSGLGCQALLPPSDFIDTHLDKLASNDALRGADLPAPLTQMVSQPIALKFPCIAKPRAGRGSRGVAVVRSREEMEAHVLLNQHAAREFVLQELLEGQEYTVMMVANQERILRAIVPVRVAIKRGVTLRATTDHDEVVIRACEAIHAAFRPSGCYNIQLIKTLQGEVKPFEINPRISTTACLGVAAGIDFVRLFLASSKEKTLLPFRNGMTLKRSWFNEFVSSEV